MYAVKVDQQRCAGCRNHLDTCPTDVYEIHNQTSAPVDPEKCIGAENWCEPCEQETISVTKGDLERVKEVKKREDRLGVHSLFSQAGL